MRASVAAGRRVAYNARTFRLWPVYMSATAIDLAPVEIKGRMLTVTVLQVQVPDVGRVLAALEERLASTGKLLRELPLVLSLGVDIDVRELVGALRGQGLMPIAVTGGGPVQAEEARSAGLAIIQSLGNGGRRTHKPAATVDRAPPPASSEPSARPAALKVVREPVRSGQRVYARDSDLVVLNQVGAGAEVIADGHIHIYGALRGRALAGARGDIHAQVFCTDYAAELVAVAGCYQLTEDLSAEKQRELLGHVAYVRLDEDSLIIEALQGQEALHR